MAQTPIEMPILNALSLSRQAYHDRDGFLDALHHALPGLRADPHAITAPIFDPFVWRIAGSFGLNGTRDTPGAIFRCARYGLASRDYFAANRLSDPETFAFAGQVHPLHDDEDVWPDGAVARLQCSFVWDDERVVLILPEDRARAALLVIFDQITAEALVAPQSGYRIEATQGAQDSVTQVESAMVELTQGHQSVQFRSFLLGGGF